METQTAPCEKCKSKIRTDAELCPECGYDPQKNGRLMRKVFFIVGLLLTASVIGSPVGIPMLVIAIYANHRVGNQRPAAV
jgi:hypothetical protein